MKKFIQKYWLLAILGFAGCTGLAMIGEDIDDTTTQSSPEPVEVVEVEEPSELENVNQPALESEDVKTLGVSKAYLQDKFSHPDVGFTFEDTQSDGSKTVTKGASPNNFSTMLIYGFDSQITKTVLSSVITTDPEKAALTSIYNLGFVNELAPGPDWPATLPERLDKLSQGQSQKEEIIVDDTLVTIELHEIIGTRMLLVTVEPRP